MRQRSRRPIARATALLPNTRTGTCVSGPSLASPASCYLYARDRAVCDDCGNSRETTTHTDGTVRECFEVTADADLRPIRAQNLRSGRHGAMPRILPPIRARDLGTSPSITTRRFTTAPSAHGDRDRPLNLNDSLFPPHITYYAYARAYRSTDSTGHGTPILTTPMRTCAGAAHSAGELGQHYYPYYAHVHWRNC